MSSEELKPCPFCGGDVSFHKDEECPGCHLIQCGQCRAFFDFATGADPSNDCESVDSLRAAIVPLWNRRAQLAAIQGGMGEVVELAKDEQSKSEYWAAAESKAFSIEVPTEVWRAGYAAGCQRITAAMAAEVERLKAEVTRWHTLACNHSRAEDQLRAELAEVKGREAVATIEQREPYEDGTPNPCKTLCWVGDNAEDDFPAGTKLYTTPPASPDVEGLVKALEATLKLGRGTSGRIILESEDEEALRTALSTWRQAHTPSTLPASSAEE